MENYHQTEEYQLGVVHGLQLVAMVSHTAIDGELWISCRSQCLGLFIQAASVHHRLSCSKQDPSDLRNMGH